MLAMLMVLALSGLAGLPPDTGAVPAGRAGAPVIIAQRAPEPGGAIRGRVVRWPVCPAETGGPECAARPIAARVVISRRAGQRVQRVATAHAGGDGNFQVALAPGDYVIEAEVAGMLCAPVDVAVPRQRHVQVTVRCDTGVR